MKTSPHYAVLLAIVLASQSVQASILAKRVIPLIKGMTITTGDYVSNVEFRVKSLGPGMCTVEVSAGAKETKRLLSPPLTWSSWQILSAHLGSVKYILDYKIGCDTDVLVEVRYAHKQPK